MEKKETRKKLLAVQSELIAPKDKFNDFSNFNYRSCEDILNALKPLLRKFNASVVITDEIVLIGERYYIKATAHFLDTENGGEICATAYAREQHTKKGMDESQVTGAASSYARKYALNGLFAIDNTADADTANNAPAPAPAKTKTTVTETPKKYICKKCGEEITEYTARKKTFSPEMIATASVNKYGHVVCIKCAKAIEAAAKAATNQNKQSEG